MKSLKDQAIEFKNLMSESWDKSMAIYDDDQIDKFYTSAFTVTFEDKVTGKVAKMNISICPESWDIFEHLAKDVIEYVEDEEMTEQGG